MMTNCPKCGTRIDEGKKFCKKCGTRLGEAVRPEISIEIEAKIDILQKRIVAKSLNVDLYIELGDIYKENELLLDALIQYQKGMNIDDTNIVTHLRSGDIYLESKEFEKALKSYETALGLDPKSDEAKLGLFKVHFSREDFEQAITLGEELVRAEPKNIEIHTVLKQIYLKKNMKEEAFREIKAISTLLPNDKEPWIELAYFYQEKDEYHKASECFETVLKIDPKDIDARFGSGELACHSKDYEKAIDYLKDIVEKVSPKSQPYAHLYLALAYINLDELNNAIKEITLVVPPKFDDLTIQQRELFAEAYHKIGIVTLDSQDLSIAVNYLEKAVEYQPDIKNYKNKLEQAIKKQATIKRKLKRRANLIATAAIIAIAMIIAGWYLSHGKVSIMVAPPEAESVLSLVKFDKWQPVSMVSPLEDASIYMDGRPYQWIITKDKTFWVYHSKNLLLGPHHIKIQKEGYEDWEMEVRVGFGKTEDIEVTLIPIYGGFNVNTFPSNAQVYIDGIHLGNTPFTASELLAHGHLLEIEKPGYRPYKENIVISKNDPLELGPIILQNLEGSWKGGPYEINLRIKQKGNSIEIAFKRKSGTDRVNGKIVKPYSYKWGTIYGSVTEGTIFAEGPINSRYYDNYLNWPLKRITITLTGTISEDWNRIEGNISGDISSKILLERVK